MGRELKNGDKVLIDGDVYIYLFEKFGNKYYCTENDWFKDEFTINVKWFSDDKVAFTNM